MPWCGGHSEILKAFITDSWTRVPDLSAVQLILTFVKSAMLLSRSVNHSTDFPLFRASLSYKSEGASRYPRDASGVACLRDDIVSGRHSASNEPMHNGAFGSRP